MFIFLFFTLRRYRCYFVQHPRSPQEDRRRAMFCPHCGKESPADSKFCGNCGTTFGAAGEAQSAAPTTATAPPAGPPPVPPVPQAAPAYAAPPPPGAMPPQGPPPGMVPMVYQAYPGGPQQVYYVPAAQGAHAHAGGGVMEGLESKIRALASTDKLEGFSLRELFKETFTRRGADAVEDYLSVGSPRTTPPSSWWIRTGPSRGCSSACWRA